MRRPRMSTGAWIFTGLICAAVIAPAGVYAASMTKVALVNSNGTNSATVTAQHQLLTTQIAPPQVIHAVKVVHGPCTTIYTPPAHKAIVVTSVVYTYGSGTQGVENFGGLFDAGCDNIYDQIDGVQAFDTIQHTWPTGLPLNGVAATSIGGDISLFIVGYLIDSTALPSAATSHVSEAVKAASPGR